MSIELYTLLFIEVLLTTVTLAKATLVKSGYKFRKADITRDMKRFRSPGMTMG